MNDRENRIGYQQYVDWMGAAVLSLADIWPESTRAMIVGLNPAPASVEAGHYYQGRTGQRQLRRLAAAGLFTLSDSSAHFEAPAAEAGVGFTDIVKRPTHGESDVSRAELEHGKFLLENQLAERNVRLIISVFRHPVEALLGAGGAPGLQEARTRWGAQVFRMPGPFEQREKADAVMATLPIR
ncbi:hypothetical protein KIV56_17085 [Cryobacterium breve]|uniref:Uracil-DNA glycosylase-like domain-containing protein n=1 Tax=Cryobacterium breve TaxID=1259258 RepID=A0ABY7NBI1_9MICO|nr:uracil-DNA glycosylase family protein [Cryobacterium breve]WBM79861.1 hypothetical protein KIV56_17085 [Cryobacterium breve]